MTFAPRDVGASDLLPNVPAPKRDREEVGPNDDCVDDTDRLGGVKRLHVDNVAPQLPSLQLDFQSDNEEFAQRHRVLVL